MVILQERIDRFGVSDEYVQIIKIKKRLYINKIDYATTKNRVLLNFIAIDEEKLKELAVPVKSQDEFELLAIVSKFMGFRIDPDLCSAAEFLSYFEEAKKESERIRAQNEKINGKSKKR